MGKEGWVRVGEHQRESEEEVVCSVWEEGDRRGELHGELLGGGGHGGGGGASGTGRSWGTAPSGERGEGRVLRLALRLGEVHLGWGMMGRGDGKGTTASGARRRRVGQGGVEGAWHARAAPGRAGFQRNRGREGGFGRGLDAWPARWLRRQRDGDAVNVKQRRREMVVRAIS